MNKNKIYLIIAIILVLWGIAPIKENYTLFGTKITRVVSYNPLTTCMKVKIKPVNTVIDEQCGYGLQDYLTLKIKNIVD